MEEREETFSVIEEESVPEVTGQELGQNVGGILPLLLMIGAAVLLNGGIGFLKIHRKRKVKEV